ncbi:MAG: amidase family protein [Sandaracinaceae bacterium]|nr:amidase family protein [Sandaracinaceae bacterium]
MIHDFLRFWGVLAFLYLRGGKLLTHPGFDASRLEPWTRGLAAYFSREPRVAFAGIPRLRRFGATYAALMRRFDVLVSPTLGEPPPPLGHLAPDLPFETKFERLVRFAAFTPIQNIAGAPAVSLPLGRTSSGLPIGVQLAAAVGGERTLLELARSLEEGGSVAPHRAERVRIPSPSGYSARLGRALGLSLLGALRDRLRQRRIDPQRDGGRR